MAAGSIHSRQLTKGSQRSVRYDVIVDLGPDPETGRRRQRKKTFATKREAQAALTRWLAEINDGTAVDRSPTTVAELLHDWLDTYARPKVRPSTLASYEHSITYHIIPSLGSTLIQQLTSRQVQRFYSKKLQDGCGPRTVQLCHMRLSQALNWAVKLSLIARNVCGVVDPPTVETKEMMTWNAEEVRRYLEEARHSHFGPIWLLALATGMRRGELLGLRWQDVDFERGTVRVRQTIVVVRGHLHTGPPKSKSAIRTIPVPAGVMATLKEHKSRQAEQRHKLGDAWHENGLVFTTFEGNPINPCLLTRDHNRWVEVSGIRRIRIHDQRHTQISEAIARGANIIVVSKNAGHSRRSITLDTYGHALPEHHSDVADKINDAYFS